jgi:hypothetical protein
MGYSRKPNYHFKTKNDTGIVEVPVGRIVVVEDFDGEIKSFVKGSNTGLTETSTVANAVTGDNLSSNTTLASLGITSTVVQLNYSSAVTSDIQGQINGKANLANPIFTGLLTEQVSVSTLTLGATSSVQTYTAIADFTIVDDLVSGESVTLILTSARFTPTYPTITWWEGAEPTLGTTDKLFFEKIGATLYGSQVASLA